MNFFDFSFWQNFTSNALATFLGAMVGIPIALWLSRYQSKNEEIERKKKILRLLKHELLMNFGQLARWNPDINNDYIFDTSKLVIFLKFEYWKAFSDGGELQWIKDPVLLSEIAEAYNFLRMISESANRYLYLIQAEDRLMNRPTLVSLVKLLNEGIENSKMEITKALKSIEKAEKK